MADFEDIILRFAADDEEGKTALEELGALLAALGLEEANPEVDIHGVARSELDLAKLLTALQALDTMNVTPDVNPQVDVDGIVEAQAQLTELASALLLIGAEHADPTVEVHGVAQALLQVSAVAQSLNDLDRKDVDVDLIVRRGRLGELTHTLTTLRNGFGGLQESVAGVGSTLGRVGVNFGAFSARLGPAIIVVITLLGSLVLSLVGGLAALASSAILAAGALAALGVGLLATLGPGLLLAIALATRLTAILQALAARQQAKLQKQQSVVQGNQQEEQSLRAIADAQESLDRAQSNLADATLQANREMADSYERVRDAVLALSHAELDRESAKLGLERARLELDKFREDLRLGGDDITKMFKKFTDVSIDFDPSSLNSLVTGSGIADREDRLHLKELILAVRQAKLQEKDATDGLSDAETELTRAQQDNLKFRQQGILASKQYVSALQSVADAEKSLARARQDKVSLAAQAKAVALTEQLSKKEEHVLTLLEKIRDAFKEAMSGVINPIWDALVEILKQVPGLLKAIAPGMRVLGEAIGAVIRAFGGEVLKPKNLAAFNLFTVAAARLSTSVGRGLIALFKIFANVARAIMPTLLDLASKFADKLDEWAAWTGKGDNLDKVIQVLVDNLMIWLQIAGQLARVFIGFLTSANGPGQKLATSLLNALTNLADMLSTVEGRKEFTKFLERSANTTISVANALKDIVVTLAALAPLVEILIKPFTIFFDIVARGAASTDEAFKIVTKSVKLLFTAVTLRATKLPGVILGALEDAFLTGLEFIKHMYQLGKDLANGLLNGIKDVLKSPILKHSLLGPLLTIPKKLFKIGSPSKVWADMGKDLMDGMILGLNSKASALGATVDASLIVPTVKTPQRTIKSAGNAVPVSHGVGKQENNINITVPGGGSPDEEALAASIERKLRRIR